MEDDSQISGQDHVVPFVNVEFADRRAGLGETMTSVETC